MPLDLQTTKPSKRHRLRTSSLPSPQPGLMLNDQSSQPIKSTVPTSAPLFADSIPPKSSKDDPPSFSQVTLTIDPTWSLIRPVTQPLDRSIPLYAISTGLNEDQCRVTTIQRLYHKFSDSSGIPCKGDNVKSTALPVYDIRLGRTRCELKPLLESATYPDLVHAEKNTGHGIVAWDFDILVEKTDEDREANTKNELVRGKTTIITRHIYRAESIPGDEGLVEWTDRNDLIVAYGLQSKRKKNYKMRTQSEATFDNVEVVEWELWGERRLKRRGRRSSQDTGDESNSSTKFQIPTLKIVEPLERSMLEYV